MPSLVGLNRRDQRSSSREYCWVYRYNPLSVQTESWGWGVFLSLSIFHEKEGIAIITSRLFQPATGHRGTTSVQMPWIGGGRSWGQKILLGPTRLACSLQETAAPRPQTCASAGSTPLTASPASTVPPATRASAAT